MKRPGTRPGSRVIWRGRRFWRAIFAAALAAGHVTGAGAQDLLPDLIVRERELLDHDLVTDGSRVLLRLSTATANIGAGPMRVVGVVPVPPGQNQAVNQVIYRGDGSSFTRPAGTFEYHPTHRHVHLEGWAIYRLRKYLEGGAVGGIVAEGGKTSFCLLDSIVHHAGLPGAPALPFYQSCGDVAQGISVGWADYYDRTLYGQNISVLGLSKGTYWLEVVVDPENHILEEDEGNNVARVPVEIGDPVLVNGPLEVAPAYETYHPPGKVDLLVGYRGGIQFYRGGNLYYPEPQILPLGGAGRRKVHFLSRVENEDHHGHTYNVRVGRTGRRQRNWSHFEGGAGNSKNITAAMIQGGHSFELGAESAGVFRSFGRRRRSDNSRPRMERLTLEVGDGSVRDLARVLVSP